MTRAKLEQRPAVTTPPKPRIVEMDIDPTTAEKWLARDRQDQVIRNRRFSQSLAEKYARLITNDKWFFDGNPIMLDTDGFVRNGLHRLTGVVLSGKTTRFAVMFDTPPEVWLIIDTGRSKSTADVLRIQQVPNSSALGSTATLLLRWREEKIFAKFQASPLEVFEFIKKTPGLSDAVHEGQRVRRALPRATVSVIAAAYHEANLLDEERCAEFFESLATGEMLESNNVIKTLRDTIIRYQVVSGQRVTRKFPQPQQLYHIVHTWNLWREGRYQQRLQIPTSLSAANFPTMR